MAPQYFLLLSSKSPSSNKVMCTLKDQLVFQQVLRSANTTPKLSKRAPLPSQSKAFYCYRAQQASLTKQTQQSSFFNAQLPIFFIWQKTSSPQQPSVPRQQPHVLQQRQQAPQWQQLFRPQRKPTIPVFNAMCSPVPLPQRRPTIPITAQKTQGPQQHLVPCQQPHAP